MKLLRAMATVAVLTGVSRITGFIRDILTANILGAGPVADAFFVALKLPNFFRRITAEGAFSVSFVPIYAGELSREGREQADLFANRTFSLMLWILTAFTALAMMAMPLVISLIAPGFNGDSLRHDLAVELSRVTFPYLLLMSLTSLLGGVMNAHDKFAPFAVAPVLFNVGIVGALLMHGLFQTPGHAMAWGVAAAGFMQFALLYICARRQIKFRVRLVKPEITLRIKKLFKLMVPGIIGAGIMQVNLFADMIIASFLPTGSISHLYYADRLNQLPLSTVGIAVGTALLPMLSRAVAAENVDEARSLFSRSLEVTLLLGLPASLALFMLAQPIITVLFEHGEFTADAAHHTARALQGYVIGLPAYIAVKVFATAFWSREDTVTPVKISIVVAVCNIALALVLIRFLGVMGIALATGIVGWLSVGLYMWILKDRKAASFDERFKMVFPKILLSTCAMGVVLYMVAPLVEPWVHSDSTGRQVLALGALVCTGLAVYGAAVLGTKAIDYKDVKKIITKGKA